MTTPTRRASALLPLLAALLLVPLAACDSGGDEPPVEDLRLAFGISFERLFSEPSAAEIQAVRQDWASRNPTANGATVVASGSFDGATVYVVSHTMSGGPGTPATHYGVVRVPDGLSDEAPVLVVHHGGDDGFSISAQAPYVTANASVEAMADVYPTLMAETVQVIPTYRAEPLLAGVAGLDAQYVSGGSASPWDYDVDDSIAFLSAALDLFGGETDETLIASIGFSRGANVALLHQIRDDRIDAVTEYYGPTDFYNADAELLALGLLSGDTNALRLPGATYLLNEVFVPLQGPGGTYNEDADYASARLEVLRRSASRFKSDLANVQIHHHVNDGTVFVSFSQAFDAELGTVSGDYEFNTYTNALPSGTSAHSPEGMPSSQAATEGWLFQYIGVSTTLAEAR